MQQELDALDGHVLSVYLDTNPANEDWKIRLKNGLKKTAEYIQAANHEQTKQFNKIVKKVDQAILDKQRTMTNSLICFATGQQILLYQLQIPVENDFSWQEGPARTQFDELIDTYSRSGVLLVQNDKVTLLTTSLGELIDETHYESDLETEDWKQYRGVSFGNVHTSSAYHRDRKS